MRRLPPFHWWRTVFYLIPAVTLYTIALGTASVVSSFFDRTGHFPHASHPRRFAETVGTFLATTTPSVAPAGQPIYMTRSV